MKTARIEVPVDGLDHPEGVAFDHRRGVLYAGDEEGQVSAVDPGHRSRVEIARTPGFVLRLAIDGLGRSVVCGRRSLVTANLGRWHLTLIEPDTPGVVPHAPLSWAVDAR